MAGCGKGVVICGNIFWAATGDPDSISMANTPANPITTVVTQRWTGTGKRLMS
ncbi:MAG: hypothetical protein OHK0012_21070 [Synechococcales cyanobacterium]